MTSRKTISYLSMVLAAILLSFAAGPAYADTIVKVSTSGITFLGSCGGSPCSEVINTSGRWDITTSSVVAGTVMVTSSPPLGTFTFTGPMGPTVAQPLFLFSAAGAGGTDVIEEQTAGTAFPAVGVYFLSAFQNLNQFFVLQCGTTACGNFLSGGSSEFADPKQGVVTISPVPEPNSLLLLATGLALGRFVRGALSGPKSWRRVPPRLWP